MYRTAGGAESKEETGDQQRNERGQQRKANCRVHRHIRPDGWPESGSFRPAIAFGSFAPLITRNCRNKMRQSSRPVVPRGEERRRTAAGRTASEPMCSPGGVTPGVVRGAHPVAP